VARYAIGDVQGCATELRALLRRIRFSEDRDELWFVGDLVNRGDASAEVLRLVRTLGDAARVVLGNHDLHLLAIALGSKRKARRDDTLEDVLGAPDRDALLEWLLGRPLAVHDPASGDLLVHAGIVPQWDATMAVRLSDEVSRALARDARAVLDRMYGDEPLHWRDDLAGEQRLRFVINAMTRLRYCTAGGTLNLKLKGAPRSVAPPWLPWFDAPARRAAGTRVIFGHWSTLGLLRRPDVIGLDTGCVWGGALSAVRLDGDGLWSEPCATRQEPGSD
jgi:bis(5'-nucleosyl)-tetraphosphatase (symmetrical)